MKPLNHILIVTKEYRHEKISSSGGTGVFYRNLAERLSKMGYRITVFGSSKKALDFEEEGIRYRFVPDYFKKNKIREMLRSLTGKLGFLEKRHFQFYLDEKKYLVMELKKFLKEENLTPQIIETHDWDGISLYLEELNIPYCIRCHGSWTVLEKYFGYKNVSKGRIYCEKLAFEKSKNNIVISQFSKKINEETFGIENPYLIYNGIDAAFFSLDHEVEVLPNSIFYLGNVSVEKGADTALRIFKNIKQKIPGASLHFIGNSNGYEKRLGEFLGEGKHEEVYFYGQQEPQKIVELLSQASLVIFPSKGETFGLSLLEAMALGKAVICSEIEVFREIINNEENGLIAVNEGDFVKKIIGLLQNDKQRQNLGAEARKTVVEKFRIEKMITETLKYYQDIYEKY